MKSQKAKGKSLESDQSDSRFLLGGTRRDVATFTTIGVVELIFVRTF